MESTKAQKGDEATDSDVQSSVSWWGSFYDSAKQKLSETNQFLVHDIKEFTETVKSDTSKLVADTAASMKDQLNIKVNLDEASNATRVVTNSISGFLGKVVQHVAPIPPDEDEDADSTMFLGTSAGVKVMTPAEARIFSLQTSPATYCNEPDNSAHFEIWRESFSLDAKKEELSLLMLDSREVRTLYTKLVPEAVSHIDFWTRYFYKKDEVEKAEERRAKLVERAQTSAANLEWGDEDEYDVIESPVAEANSTTESIPPRSSPPVVEVPQTTATDQSSTCVVTNTSGAPLTQDDHAAEPTNETRSPVELALTSGEPDIPPTCISGEPNKDPTPLSVPQSNSEASSAGMKSDPISPAVARQTNPNSSVQPSTSETNDNAPSPKGLESSSGADSSDWEKEFDLDMTEDEIIEALQEEDNEDEIEGWEEWE